MNTNTSEMNMKEMNMDELEAVNGGSDEEGSQKNNTSFFGRWLKHLMNH